MSLYDSDEDLSSWQESVADYDEAVRLRNIGEAEKAETILRELTSNPTIAHGYYRELFKLLRVRVKNEFKKDNFKTVVYIVNDMIRLNKEMLNAMSRYWTVIHGKSRTVEYFSSYSHLKVTEVRLMLKSAVEISDKYSIKIAEKELKRIEKRNTSKGAK